MAIYHLNMKVIQRSQGQSAIAAAAYRRAARLHNETENKDHDYTNKPDVIHSEILIPANSPQWLKEMAKVSFDSPHKGAEDLWNKVEISENRKDAQFSREIELSLPIELDQEQNIILAREFIKDQFVSRGMVADWNVHWDEGNPHVHAMVTMREITPEGFGFKNREWNKREMLCSWREKWSEYANFHLKLHEHSITIDHRSFKDRGIDLIPTVHQGKSVTDMERRGIVTDTMQEANIINRENLRRMVAKPELALEIMAAQSSSFSYEQLGQILGKYINDRGNFSSKEVETDSVIVESTLSNFEKVSGNEATQKVLTPNAIADIFKKIEQHDAVFSQDDLIKALSVYTANAEIFAKAVIEIKASPELIYLGAGVDGRDRFTTKKMFHLENEIQKNADILNHQKHIEISSSKIKATIKSYQAKTGNVLTDEQTHAIKHVLAPSSLSCIVGRAGTGKSFSLGAANSVWASQGMRVLGVSLSGIASDGLSRSSGIQSQTLAAFKCAIENQTLELGRNDVIVMDEAGMTDNELMHFVLKEAKVAKAKLVLVGDPDQLQPIGPGAVFRALLERTGFAELQTIYRQKEEWQKQATLKFAAGQVDEGLKAYEEKGFVHIERDKEGAMSLLVNDWFKMRLETQKLLHEYLVIAHSNDDVNNLNSRIRSGRVANGEIAEGHDVLTSVGTLKIAKDDRILFLKPYKTEGIEVKNGWFATVSSVDFTETGRILKINVVLDNPAKTGKGGKETKEISIDPNQYHHFAHGYAATVHKVQGASVDHNFVYVGNGGFSWDRFLSYVAMSRHKISCHLYANKEDGYGEFNLSKQLGKKRIKDSVMDYPLSFAERRDIDTSGLLSVLPKKLADRLNGFKKQLTQKYENITKVVAPKVYQQRQADQSSKLAKQAQQEKQKEMVLQKSKRNEDARIIADYVDANRNAGIFYQVFQEKLNTLGLDKISYEAENFAVISATTEYQNLNKALHNRNRIAANFVPNIENYAEAIEHYGLDHNKLQKQANAHEYRENILAYQSNADKPVLKDRIALNIMDNTKVHYPFLKEFEIKTSDLRKDATAHLRRGLLTGLNEQERQDFHRVERYHKLTLEIGKLWAEKISLGESVVKTKDLTETTYREKSITGLSDNKENNQNSKNEEKILDRHELIRFNVLNHECEKLAGEILQNRDSHHKALNFFQIGVSAPLFNYDKSTEQNIRANENKAQKRWYQLQQRAARHDINQRVIAYQKAVFLNDTPTRLKLAHEIVSEQKAHYGAIINLDANTYGIRQAMNRDARLYDHQNFYSSLNDAEKTSFKLVEEYAKNKNAYGSAWREIFESEKTSILDKNKVFEKLGIYTKPYKLKRNELAEKILLNIPDKKILDYFKVDLMTLYPQLNEHRLSEQVDQYVSETNIIKRGEIAQKIVEDPKPYSKYVFEKSINWKSIYSEHQNYTRKKLFENLTSEEKRFLRLTRRYNILQRQSGKAWSVVFKGKEQEEDARYKNKNQKFVITENSINSNQQKQLLKAQKITSRRDALAAQVLNAKQLLDFYGMMDNSVIASNPLDLILQSEGKALSLDKLQKQAQNHQKRLTTVNQFKEAYEGLQKSLSHDKASEINIDEQSWALIQKDIKEAIKPIKQNYALYSDALKQRQMSEETIEILESSIEKISVSLKELSRIKINKNALEKIEKQNILLAPEQQQKVFKAQRIAKGTRPIVGTLAERYLREHRGIQGKLPESFRYHPAHYNHLAGKTLPALVVLARNEQDQIQAVQIISLDPDTANKACGKQSKISYGTLSHAGVLVSQGDIANPTLIAEGPETALSVSEAMPRHTVYAALGSSNFAHMPLGREVKSVIFAADNDGKDAASGKQLEKAANTLSLQGIDVACVMPESIKQDFNDVLKEKGIPEIKALFQTPQSLQRAVDQENLKQNIVETVNYIRNFKIDSHDHIHNQVVTDQQKDEQINQDKPEIKPKEKNVDVEKTIDQNISQQESINNQLEIKKSKNILVAQKKQENIDTKIKVVIDEEEDEKVDVNHKDYWKQLSRESVPIKGTLAEKYFQNLGLEAKNYRTVHFHSRVWHKETESYFPALIVTAIKNVNGKLSEQGIQIHYLDEKTGNKAKIKRALNYMGDDNNTYVILQPAADRNDERWVFALDIDSALTVTQSNPEKRVALIPYFHEIEKFPISGEGRPVTLCFHPKFPKKVLNNVIESFQEKNFQLSLAVIDKEKPFSQVMKEKGKSYISEKVNKAERIYSPDVVEVMERFNEYDEKMIEIQDMPRAYKSIEKKKLAEFIRFVNKDEKLVKQLSYQAPEISKRMDKFMEKLKEIVRVR